MGAYPHGVDWNNDGKMDLIAGDYKGNVSLFLNTGAAGNPQLAKAQLVEADGKPVAAGSHNLTENKSKIHMADWDGDGLKDLLIGYERTMVLCKNVGTASAPRFQAPVAVQSPDGSFPQRPSPYVVDWDGDGKQDLLVGTEKSQVIFYRNVGTATGPKLAKGAALALKGAGLEGSYRWRIDVADWNNDGKKDLLVGTYYSRGRSDRGGNVWLFLGK